MSIHQYSYGNTTHVYDIPDVVLTDLVNSMVMLRTMSEHDPRLDRMGQINVDLAADAIQALIDLANEQHPVPPVEPQVRVIPREAVPA